MTSQTHFPSLSSSKGVSPIVPVFDVDPRNGFMASEPPLSRLPPQWELWETTLDQAIKLKLRLGDNPETTEEQKKVSRTWRLQLRSLPVLPTSELNTPVLLRRAHLVLTYLLHFYVQSLPPNEEVLIPRSISVPILRVANSLDLPPVLTFSDTVLYNWAFKSAPSDAASTTPALDNIRTQTMFTSTVDEEEFYLCSARIELRGVEVLDLMRNTLDEIFVGDSLAAQRIAGYLRRMADVIGELKALLMCVTKLCDPDKYYNEVRPWFRGEDSDMNKRKWVFDGVEDDASLKAPTQLSGPSAGQSSLIHVIDLFLGVDHQSKSPNKPSFMLSMQTYMPHNHRMFLNHLATYSRPLRGFVDSVGDKDLVEAYNHALLALKQFRDSHMIIATLYIIGPARRAVKARHQQESSCKTGNELLKGTGGTDLVTFLKDTRTRTTQAMLD